MRMTGTGSSDNRPRRLSIEHRSAVIRRSSAAGLGPRAAAELANMGPVSAAECQIQLVCVPLVSARGACLGVLQARRCIDSGSDDLGSGPFVAHEELVLGMSCVFISSGTSNTLKPCSMCCLLAFHSLIAYLRCTEIRRCVKAAQHAARLSAETARTQRQKDEVTRLQGAVKGIQEIGRKAEYQAASLTKELREAKHEIICKMI